MNAPLPFSVELQRGDLPDWPRLMGAELAAKYIGLSVTSLDRYGPAAKAVGRRRLYDRHDLDRWADALGGQPLDAGDEASHKRQVERTFLEGRATRKAPK